MGVEVSIRSDVVWGRFFETVIRIIRRCSTGKKLGGGGEKWGYIGYKSVFFSYVI